VNAFCRDVLATPKLVSFLVARNAFLPLKNGDVELVFGQTKPLRRGNQLPGERDRIALEVVAKAEIAQHFEEGVVAAGEADILQVVMLAAGAHAFL
jgi:hypothetical protein